MSLLIDAKTARKKTDANKQSALDAVVNKIIAASNNGEEYVVVDTLSEFCIEQLEAAEFKIDQRTAISNGGIKIKW